MTFIRPLEKLVYFSDGNSWSQFYKNLSEMQITVLQIYERYSKNWRILLLLLSLFSIHSLKIKNFKCFIFFCKYLTFQFLIYLIQLPPVCVILSHLIQLLMLNGNLRSCGPWIQRLLHRKESHFIVLENKFSLQQFQIMHFLYFLSLLEKVYSEFSLSSY